jgi:hypothetical protein
MENTTYIDDNFGDWQDMGDPEMQDFYAETQSRSVEKVCSICGQTVRILPQYDKCNACMEMMEGGRGC